MAYMPIKNIDGKTYVINLNQVISVELETVKGDNFVNIVTSGPAYKVYCDELEVALMLMYNITGLTPVPKQS